MRSSKGNSSLISTASARYAKAKAFGSIARCGFSYGETNRGSEMKLTATVFADEHTARRDRICSPARSPAAPRSRAVTSLW